MKYSPFLTLILFVNFGFSQKEKREDAYTGYVFELINNDSLSPLTGVNVYYPSSSSGTITNSDGFFNIAKNPNYKTLIFSYTGYQTDTLEINNKKEINIVMSEGKILKDLIVEFKKGSYTFSKMDPRNAHLIGQDELRKAACCNLAESFETNPSIDATFTDAITGTKQIQMMGLSGKYVQMLSGNIPIIRGISILNGLRQIPGSFIHEMAVSKGSGSVLNGYESMVGQININLKQPENAEKLHLNFYLNQGGRSEYNAFFSKKFNNKWSTTLLAHFEDQQRTNDRNKDGFLDNPLRNDFVFHNQWNYRSKLIHMELGINGVTGKTESGKKQKWLDTAIPVDYGVDMTTNKINGFAKIGYLFPNDDFKSLALQLSSTYNKQNSTIGPTVYIGSQYSGYANLIYQQEVGINKDENYFKVGASCQLDSLTENVQSFTVHPPINRFLEIVPGVFGEFTHNSEKFGLITGLRGDYTSFYNTYFLTPRLHFRYSPNTDLAFKFMAGSGRRTPFMLMENMGYMASSRNWIIDENVYGIQGLMDDVGQEYSLNLGLAMVKEFTFLNRDGVLTLDAYHTSFINQLVIDLYQSARELHFYALNGKSFSNSFQAEINFSVNRRLDIRTAYRFLDVKTKYKSGLIEKPLLSKHRGFLNIAYSTRKIKNRQWKIDLTTQWIGSQRIPFTGDNDSVFQLLERSEGYLLLNGQLTRTFGKKIDAYLGVENALNYRQVNPILSSENPYSEYFDSALIWAPIFGRMIYLGFRFTIKD
jgi:outer membrane receptor for ferrienterochelin and colicins